MPLDCYFFELGVKLLRPGGRMSYISSSTFFKTGSGEPLRKFLLKTTAIVTVVDFGDLQVFERVTTYPAVITVRKHADSEIWDENSAQIDDAMEPICFLNLTDTLPLSLAAHFESNGKTMPQSQLGAASWQLEGVGDSKLVAKFKAAGRAIKDVYGSPLYGVKTGFDRAFVVDRVERDTLIRADVSSEHLLKRMLEGKDLHKWHCDSQDLWLIYIPRNAINMEQFPAIKAHLLKYRNQLEGRATKQAWFELQQAQAAYASDFERELIMYPDMSQGSKFSLVLGGAIPSTTIFAMRSGDPFLLGILNSAATWYQIQSICPALRGGVWRYRLKRQYMEEISIPSATANDRDRVGSLASSCQTAAEERRDLVKHFGHEVLRDLAPGSLTSKLPGVLQDWATLDFAGFTAAIKKHLRQDIPLNDRNAWEAKLKNGAARVAELTTQIKRAEREIDQIVYRLFDLTPDEVALIEAAVK